MEQQPIELILLRQWASYVMVPVFMVGSDGRLLYFNDSAARLLGRSYEDAGEMSTEQLAAIFETGDEGGKATPSHELPISRALRENRPMCGPVRFTGLDGVRRHVEIAAVPIEGHGAGLLGVMTVFWEVDEP